MSDSLYSFRLPFSKQTVNTIEAGNINPEPAARCLIRFHMASSNNQDMILLKDEHRLQIMELGALCVVSMALYTVVKLKVPDIIFSSGENAQLSAAEIAANIPGCKSPSSATAKLSRVLRALSARGIFKETCVVDAQSGPVPVQKYSLTPLSKLLIKDNRGLSLTPWVLVNQDDIFMRSWGHFLCESITEGGDEPFKLAHGRGIFEMAQENGRMNDLFNSTMAGHTAIYLHAVLEVYQGFKAINTLVDVGGGYAASLKAIVAYNPNIRGINFDLPHVIDTAPNVDGVEHVGGNMFESVPEGDAIFMKWILHDWKDEDCIKLLKNCYKSLPIGGKVVVMDVVLPAAATNQDSASSFAFSMDMLMLAHCEGKERTEDEFRSIGNAAGFTKVELIVTVDFMSLLEMHKTC